MNTSVNQEPDGAAWFVSFPCRRMGGIVLCAMDQLETALSPADPAYGYAGEFLIRAAQYAKDRAAVAKLIGQPEDGIQAAELYKEVGGHLRADYGYPDWPGASEFQPDYDPVVAQNADQGVRAAMCLIGQRISALQSQ